MAKATLPTDWWIRCWKCTTSGATSCNTLENTASARSSAKLSRRPRWSKWFTIRHTCKPSNSPRCRLKFAWPASPGVRAKNGDLMSALLHALGQIQRVDFRTRPGVRGESMHHVQKPQTVRSAEWQWVAYAAWPVILRKALRKERAVGNRALRVLPFLIRLAAPMPKPARGPQWPRRLHRNSTSPGPGKQTRSEPLRIEAPVDLPPRAHLLCVVVVAVLDRGLGVVHHLKAPFDQGPGQEHVFPKVRAWGKGDVPKAPASGPKPHR